MELTNATFYLFTTYVNLTLYGISCRFTTPLPLLHTHTLWFGRELSPFLRYSPLPPPAFVRHARRYGVMRTTFFTDVSHTTTCLLFAHAHRFAVPWTGGNIAAVCSGCCRVSGVCALHFHARMVLRFRRTSVNRLQVRFVPAFS